MARGRRAEVEGASASELAQVERDLDARRSERADRTGEVDAELLSLYRVGVTRALHRGTPGAAECRLDEPFFALMEATLITAIMSQRFVYELVPGHPVVPEATLTLRPRYGLPMIARRRRQAAVPAR